jgi:hypothetical protein
MAKRGPKPSGRPPKQPKRYTAKDPDNPKPVSVRWQRDPHILARLELIESYRLRGYSALRTAQTLGMPHSSVALDYRRLDDLSMARLNQSRDRLRAQMLRRLDNVIMQAHQLIERDERYTEAVLFGLPVIVTCPGRQEHSPEDLLMKDRTVGEGNDRHTTWGVRYTCLGPHPMEKLVHRDEKGSAQYRRIAGQVVTTLRATIMDQAKLAGLIVDQKALTTTDGVDLPSALRDMLVGETLTPDEVRSLPSANEQPDDDMDVGLA